MTSAQHEKSFALQGQKSATLDGTLRSFNFWTDLVRQYGSKKKCPPKKTQKGGPKI